MRISQLLKEHFGADVRNRAAPYFYGRAVRVLQGNSFDVWATVRGSSTYNVTMTLADDTLHMLCTCPYYTEHGVGCKHLWAAVLTAERDGYLSELLRQPSVEVIFDDEEFTDGRLNEFAGEETDVDDDEEEDDWTRPAPGPTVASDRKKLTAPKKERPAAWSRVFKQIQQSSSIRPAQIGAPWLANRQLLYVIDAPRSLATQTVLLEVAFQERKKDGDWSKPKFQAITQQQAEQIREGPDADQGKKDWGHTGFFWGPVPTIHVPRPFDPNAPATECPRDNDFAGAGVAPAASRWFQTFQQAEVS